LSTKSLTGKEVFWENTVYLYWV